MNKYIIKLLLFFNICINIIFYIIFIILLLVSAYALYDSYQIYDSTKIEEINVESPLDDFNYPNVIGYINIKDTTISYPILKGNDNIEYLSKTYKGEYSFSGSIFLDYRNSSDFSDEYSIIYGHSLKKGGMFSDIKKYKDKDYFDNHLNGKLYLKDIVYDIEVIMISKVKYSDGIYNLNTNNIISHLMKSSINKVGIIDKNNRILILSTCSSSSKIDRLIIVSFLK